MFEPAIRRALSTSSRNLPDVTISKDSYAIFSVISAGMDAGSRVVDLTSPLALAGVPIFFITTYYSDFVLVPTHHRHRVVKTLLARGFVFADDDSKTESYRPAGAHSRAGSQASTTNGAAGSPPPTPTPSSIGELQLRTFELLIKRSVVPYVDGPLHLVSCSGREKPESSMLALRGYGNYPGRPETRRRDTHDGAIPRRTAWVDKADTKLYAGAVSALVAQPRFLSITLTLEDPPSLLLDRALLELFGDSLVGPTEGTLVPIFLDLDTLPFEATGIVSGVAGKLVQEMQMAESAELSYLSTARAGAVILSEEQAAKALVILKGALKG